MKPSLEQIKAKIDSNMGILQADYAVKNIGVFGSVAREQHDKASDIDILVEFAKPIGFFKFIELEEFLSRLTGKKVDLVTKNALKDPIRDEVLQEVIYV